MRRAERLDARQPLIGLRPDRERAVVGAEERFDALGSSGLLCLEPFPYELLDLRCALGHARGSTPRMAIRRDLAKQSYRAYETGDRSLIEPLLTDDFEFFAPPDP